ncbi:hypothetical protein BB561_004219 [Smittium simulii]|uniref:Dipeptidyl-peptidase V n=1 Tax=Smittium simulii TaxID=133385 RepID=A0A2T9YHL8_9FUNG|nr:hypothetical protein BB561_004219 [Smittium simulii]
MKSNYIFVSLCLSAVTLADVFNPDPKIFPNWDKVKRFTPDQNTQMKKLGFFDLSPNKQHVVFSQSQYNNTSNKSTNSLYLIDLNSPGAAAELTEKSYTTSDSNPIWINEDIVAFLAVRGSPATNLFTVSVSSKTITQVTNFTNSIGGIVYNSAAKKIAFTSSVYQGKNMEESAAERKRIAGLSTSAVEYNQLLLTYWDTWIKKDKAQIFTITVDVSKNSLKLVDSPVNVVSKYNGQYGLEPSSFAFSADGQEIVFSAAIPNRDAGWSTEAGVFTTPSDGSAAPKRHNNEFKATASQVAYSPDTKYVAWLQMTVDGYGSDQNQVILLDLFTGKHSRLISDFDNSPSVLKFSSDSKHLYLVAGVEKDVALFKVNIETDQMTRLTKDGSVSSFAEISSEKLIINISTLQYPNSLYTIDVQGKADPKKVYFENDKALEGIWVSPTETFWFTGALNEKVQGLVLYPYGFDPSKKHPVAMLIHGGPHASWTDSWSYRWNGNLFANQGYIIVIINFHGGNNYGQNFTNSVLKNWGTHPYYDVINGFDYFLDNAKYSDSNNTVALGASYGGYMINWINGHTDRFRALVLHAAVFNTVAISYTTDTVGFMYVEQGEPLIPSERAVSEANSPEKFAANFKTPSLVTHGMLDYRVPLSEGIAAFNALQRVGVDSKFILFPDENHWIMKPGNSLKWHTEVFAWIGKYSNMTTWSW